MDKKDIQKLLKRFEEKGLKPLTAENYFSKFICRNYYPDKDVDFQIFVICTDLHYCSASELGIYFAFKSGDMELLNDAVYHKACEKHLSIVLESGYDHSWCYGNVLLYSMAANLFERVPLLIPKHLGMAKIGYRPSVIAANLFMALYYKDPVFAEQARKEAAAKLKTKMNRFDTANILYLLSLLDGNTDEASQHLKNLCEGVKRLKYTTSVFDTIFCIEAHGLYNLARYLGIEGIAMPEASNFSKEFAEWQLLNGSKPGKPFLHYPAPLAIINTILSVIPPEIQLYHPYPNDVASVKRQRIIDSQKFKEQIIKEIKQAAGL